MKSSEHIFSTFCIVTDLDGTLLDNEQLISTKNRHAIEDFQKKGGFFTVATGRTRTSIVPFIDQLQIRHPIITHNGAQIFCPVTERVIYRQSLVVTKSLEETLEKLENAEVIYFIDEKIYTQKKSPLIHQFEVKEQLTVMEKAHPFRNEPVTKIIIAHSNHTWLTAVEQQILNEKHSLCTTFSEPEYLELLPKKTSKGIALQHLRNQYIGSERHVVSFGNNLNDISLLSEADIGVAVGNAHPLLKSVSTKVLENTNCEDALAHYIEQLQNAKEHA